MVLLEVQEYSWFGIPQFIEYFGDKFNGMVTKEAYAEYQKFWKGQQISKISFSRFIVKFTDYRVKGVSIGGKKLRIFVRKDGSSSIG